MKQPTEPMAHEISAPDLLRSAARLVERALIKLDTAEAPCPNCSTRLFHDREHARVYEQLQDLPGKLHTAAERVQNTTHRASSGYDIASITKQVAAVAPSGGDPS